MNIYGYCYGNPITFADPTGHDAWVFTTTEFEKNAMIDSKIIQDKLDTSVHVVIIQDPDDFVTYWNIMEQYGDKKDANIDFVEAIFHSNPSGMSMGRDASSPEISLKGMKSKNINTIALRGCNAGFASNSENNLAETFLFGNNVNQVVVSDGTVSRSNDIYNSIFNEVKYSSLNDDIFKSLLTDSNK